MIGPVRKPLTGLRINTGTDLLTEMVGTARTIISPTMQETTAGTLHTVRRFRPNRVAAATAASGIDLSLVHHGYTIASGTCTLRAGILWLQGKVKIAVASYDFVLAGTQFASVHHTRGSTTATWTVTGVEPGVDTQEIYWPFYKFVDGVIDDYYRFGGDVSIETLIP